MARNAVQFQKGLSEPAFEQLYGTEEQCRAIVIASRWPNGFWLASSEVVEIRSDAWCRVAV